MRLPQRTTVAAAAATLAFAGAGTTSADAKPLKRGAHGQRVKALQRALHLTSDGVFGPGTSRVVRRFQRHHHLHADGIVGAATWRMVRQARHGRTRTSTAGSGSGARVARRGPAVRLLQRRIGIAADGVFGPGTARAVKRAQRRHGLTADGIVGPATWAAIGIGGHHSVLKRAHLGGGGGSGTPGLVFRAVGAANRIARLPYRYGGGHGSFRDSAYDCSGSISYVLHAIGRLGAPRDSGRLMGYGAPGRGRWITIYANPGHAYMVINGRRFDTSARFLAGSRWTGQDRASGGYVVRHPPGL